MARLTKAYQIIKRVCFLRCSEFPERPNMMNWNRATNNQTTILASAAIACNSFCPRFKPALTSVGSYSADPVRRVFAGEVLTHKQPVTRLTAKQGLSVLLSDFPRFALKGCFALLAGKRSGFDPSRIFITTHAVRGEGVRWPFPGAERIAKLMVVGRWIFSKDKLGLTATRAKARFIGTVNRLLILAPTLCALIGNAISFSKPATSATAKLCVSSLGRNSVKRLVALLAGNFDFHSRIIPQFMGSGTTLRAAKDLGLKSIGIEIERKYCDIAIERLRQRSLFSVMPSETEVAA